MNIRTYIIVALILYSGMILGCSQKSNEAVWTANNNSEAPTKTQEPATESYDFRRVTWGMSRDQVKATEPTPPLVSDSEMIGYKTEVARKDAYCMYGFVDDKLAVGMYQFKDLHSNKNDYFEDFAQLKKMLTEKYGTPQVDEVEWKKKTYKDNPEHWGMAVGLGELKYRAKWETERTNILLLLYGNNFDVTLMARYDSKEFRPLFDEVAKKKGRSDF